MNAPKATSSARKALSDELREPLVGSKRSTTTTEGSARGGDQPSYGSFARDANMSRTMQVTTINTDHASSQAIGEHTGAQPSQPSQPTMATAGARLFMSKLTRRRRGDGGGGGGHASTSSSWRLTHMLENKGSVARDHLANERTFLAWLRTSLSLASIGIAITQLFRLASTSVPTGTSTGTGTTESASSSAVSNSSTLHLRSLLQRAVVQSDNSNESSMTAAEELHIIRQIVLEQAEQILLLQGQANGNPLKYRHLGKPIGGTFIGLALLFLLLGANRYFSVQAALMKQPKSMFPPSRRTVTFTSFCVAAIVIATFAAILAVR
ncbi:BQ2448_6131 [Microbotryum intermedium]|uniref:BQ2448_6131 protein n=1 Tax=Microbotryum intermedium TaxID=269621 RepID=A0A238FNF4_9BASI|nr:BQ2448_6131 [Microbotryum intermedium]